MCLSVNVFQISLFYEVFALRAKKIVLTIFLQLNNSSIFRFKLSIVCEAAHFDVETLWRVKVLREVQPCPSDAAHVAAQRSVVAIEPLHLLLAQT